VSFLFVLRVSSVLLLIVSGFMGISAAVGIAYGEVALIPAFAIPMAASVLFFAVMQIVAGRRGRPSLSVRGSYLFVTLSWLLATALGAIPMVLSGAIPRYADAFFEVMSGFTTTGASILSDVEVLPRCILFWRSLTHWLGGMGIVVLTVAVFPLLGIRGVRLIGAESPGPTVDKLTPRITATAKIFWGIYLLLTAAQVILLLLGGMDLFDATTHTFGTLGTGGFSTRNASVGAYNSAYIDAVVTVFMLLAAANFALYYRVGRGK
jgi:trk system potassium uptake protein